MNDDYPNLWKRGLIQPRVRERAHHRCEQCGMEFNPGTNVARVDRNRDGSPVVGGVHHIDHNKQNCSGANLVFLCQRCHYTLHCYDWRPGDPLLLRWYGVVPQWIRTRHIPYLDHPQLRLFEVES